MPRKLSLFDLTDYHRRKDEIAQQLLHAASDAGFFWITGHGISQASLTCLRCFELPTSSLDYADVLSSSQLFSVDCLTILQ